MARPPTLDARDVERGLRNLGFRFKHQRSSHRYWEGYIEGVRRVVTVDANDAPFHAGSRTLKSMIRPSGVARKVFYRAAGKPLR